MYTRDFAIWSGQKPRIPRENSPLGDATPNFQWTFPSLPLFPPSKRENRIPTIDNQFSYPL